MQKQDPYIHIFAKSGGQVKPLQKPPMRFFAVMRERTFGK
jgi:hypothetical protein